MMTHQRFLVSGRVTEGRTGRSLPDLSVRILAGVAEPSETVGRDHTDRDGEFSVLFSHRSRSLVMSVAVGDQRGRELHRTVPRLLVPDSPECHAEIVLGIEAIARAPRVTLVRPARAGPGDIVDINGSGFGTESTAVRVTLGGREAMVLGVTPQHLIVRLPADAGPVDPLVIRVGELRTALSGLIAVLPSPASAAVAPCSPADDPRRDAEAYAAPRGHQRG
jgi:hypothetical protein